MPTEHCFACTFAILKQCYTSAGYDNRDTSGGAHLADIFILSTIAFILCVPVVYCNTLCRTLPTSVAG
jgi:hypothetical protein